MGCDCDVQDGIILCALYNRLGRPRSIRSVTACRSCDFWLGSRERPGSRRQDGVAVPRTVNAGSWVIEFETFDGYLKDPLSGDGPQIIDASLWRYPNRRIAARRHARIKAGETPASLRRTSRQSGAKRMSRRGGHRLQEPCRGPSAQAGAALSCERLRRVSTTDPSPRRYAWMGTTRLWVCGRTALTARQREIEASAEGEGVAEP